MSPPVWEALVGRAVLGSERRPFARSELPEVDAAIGADLAGNADLADVCSGVWAYLRAGAVPGAPAGDELAGGVEAVAVDQADPRPWLGRRALRTLEVLLDEVRLRPLVGEWLALAASDGRRLPPEWLPLLLEVTGPEERADLHRAAGPRLAWLIGCHPAWADADMDARALADAFLGAGDGRKGDQEWGGPDPVRVTAFRLVRAADPARAREIAEAVWAAEPAVTRPACVAAFAAGLTMADEPFLEGRLDDRRQEVRMAAADVLGRLPASGLAGRMAGRAGTLVRWDPGGDATLRVQFPPAPDAAGRRDGLPGGRPGKADGYAAVRLRRIVAATPLDYWTEVLGARPADIVGAAAGAGRLATGAGPPATGRPAARGPAAQGPGDGGRGDEGPDTARRAFLDGLADASVAQFRPDWAEALATGHPQPPGALSTALDRDGAERVLVGRMDRFPLASSLELLRAVPGRWSLAVTSSFLAALTELVAAADPGAPGAVAVRDALAESGRRADPRAVAALPGLLGALEALGDGRKAGGRLMWSAPVNSFAALLRFRAAMHQEFRRQEDAEENGH